MSTRARATAASTSRPDGREQQALGVGEQRCGQVGEGDVGHRNPLVHDRARFVAQSRTLAKVDVIARATLAVGRIGGVNLH